MVNKVRYFKVCDQLEVLRPDGTKTAEEKERCLAREREYIGGQHLRFVTYQGRRSVISPVALQFLRQHNVQSTRLLTYDTLAEYMSEGRIGFWSRF